MSKVKKCSIALIILSCFLTYGRLCLAGLTDSGFELTPSPLAPLTFRAELNNVRVLPQRFEYSLLDEDRLSVGNILIDWTQLTFQLSPSSVNKNNSNIRFTWPGGLIKNGQLKIRDNSGKSIFSRIFNKDNITISKGQAMEDHENLHSEIATLALDELNSDFVESMRYLPFLVFHPLFERR